jgi:hypothetical protein
MATLYFPASSSHSGQRESVRKPDLPSGKHVAPLGKNCATAQPLQMTNMGDPRCEFSARMFLPVSAARMRA